MRVISQNGQGDMPYESFVFGVHGNVIIASKDISFHGEISRQVVASYSSEVKAIAAMYAMRENYAELVDRLSKNLSVDNYAVFRFPQDSEVEA